MAETIGSIRVQVTVSGMVQGEDGAAQRVLHKYDETFTDGSGDNQMGNVWQDETRPLNTTSEDLDLGTGGLNDFQGDALVATGLKLVWLQNLSEASGEDILLKGGSSNPVADLMGGTSPTLRVTPKGLVLIVAPVDGYTVTDGSADTLAVETTADQSYKAVLGVDNA